MGDFLPKIDNQKYCRPTHVYINLICLVYDFFDLVIFLILLCIFCLKLIINYILHIINYIL